jgi:20S proteasome alpha/beta subunit
MTYILGSVCSDGVVLVGDRKVTLGDGTASEYEDKIFLADPWIIVGSSGVSGLFDKFRDSFMTYLTTPGRETTVLGLTTQIEKITRELNVTYRDVLHGQVFDVLLGIKTTGLSVLQYVYPFGLAEGVKKYKVIGHGEPYGSLFLKHWWHENMTMLQVAELGFFIIKCIQEFELDSTVGIGKEYPQIWLVPNLQVAQGANAEDRELTVPRVLSGGELSDLNTKVTEKLRNFKRQKLI